MIHSGMEAPNTGFVLGLALICKAQLESGMTAPGGPPPSHKGPTRIQQTDVKSSSTRCMRGARYDAVKKTQGSEDVRYTHCWGCFLLEEEGLSSIFPTGGSRLIISVTSGVANRRATITKPELTMWDGCIKGRKGELFRSTPLNRAHYPSC